MPFFIHSSSCSSSNRGLRCARRPKSIGFSSSTRPSACQDVDGYGRAVASIGGAPAASSEGADLVDVVLRREESLRVVPPLAGELGDIPNPQGVTASTAKRLRRSSASFKRRCSMGSAVLDRVEEVLGQPAQSRHDRIRVRSTLRRRQEPVAAPDSRPSPLPTARPVARSAGFFAFIRGRSGIVSCWPPAPALCRAKLLDKFKYDSKRIVRVRCSAHG